MEIVSTTTSAPSQGQHELVITRVLDAPRGLVFEAWTRREHLVRWWGPRDFTTTSCEMDLRTGGAYRACIRSPDGKDYWMRGRYREIVPPERLVMTFAWEEEGERGLENLVTVTFAEHAGKTRLTFKQAPFQSVEERDSHDEGWGESLERLAAFLAER